VSSIFVAGATGAVGRRAVRLLVAAGHDVTAVARNAEKAAFLESLGARAVRVDLFDAPAVKDAVAGHDVVINLATHIPRAAKAGLPGAWDENDRIRTEVSRNLVDAALASGASRYVQESIVFGYEDAGDAWIGEGHPFTGREYASVLVAEANAHRFTEESGGGTGVVLRFGMFYDAESHTTRDLVRGLAAGRLPLPGRSEAYAPFVATDDAAAAVVAALGAPAGTYNVVDDEPLTRAELALVASGAVGRPVKTLPAVVSKAVATRAEPLSRSQRVSNAAFKAATGWAPRVPSARSGLPPVVHAVLASSRWARRGSLLARLLLALLLPATVTVGLWAEFAPRSFYDDFPGLGLVWVASDGPFNEHLVRDFGATNLAIAVLVAVAVWKGGRLLLATAAGAYLAYAVPHLVYHLRHTHALEGADLATSLASLAFAAALAAAAALVTIHRRDMTR
jgi:nucleoside-diphosphate-sugar epimerase